MGRLRPRREVILKAFELALQGKHGKLIRELLDRPPPEAMSWHTVHTIIFRTDTLRQYPQYMGSKQLRPAVRRALPELGIPHDIRYAYEVVTMRYYNIIWQYVAAVRRKRREILAARRAALEKATKAA